MTSWKTLLIAAPVAMGLLAAPAAHAEWRGHPGWHGGWGHSRGPGWGLPLAGALLGAAVVGGIVAAQPPAVVYAPPPAYYPPPAYAYPPAYYSQPYYAAPGY